MAFHFGESRGVCFFVFENVEQLVGCDIDLVDCGEGYGGDAGLLCSRGVVENPQRAISPGTRRPRDAMMGFA